MPAGTISRRTYFAVLLALMVVTAGGVFSNGLFFLTQPYQLNYGESLVAWQAARVTDLATAYAPLDRSPFVAFQYPPLFHVTSRTAARAIDGDLLVAARSISLLSAALLCVVIGTITFQALPHRASWQIRLIAAAFAGTLPATLYNFNWMWLARVDTLAILLSFSGVALFAARAKSPTANILAAILMTAAIFTRQTALAAPLACLLIAFLIDRRIALRMLATMGILGGLVLGWLVWKTDGQILLHLFRYNQTAFSITRAIVGVLRNGRWVAGPFVMAAGASIAVLSSFARRRSALRMNRYRRTVLLLSVYSLFAALGTLANGKEGSDINYFLEWNVSLAPLAGIFLMRLVPTLRNMTRLRPVQLAALAVPILVLNAAVPTAGTGWLRVFAGPLPTDREQIDIYRRALATVAQTPGPVFSEDMNLLNKTGKEIPAEPAMIQCLAQSGLWDERPFVRMIQERQFALIVTMLSRETEERFSPRRYSPAVASAIEQGYELTSMIGDYMFFRPRAIHDVSAGAPQRP